MFQATDAHGMEEIMIDIQLTAKYRLKSDEMAFTLCVHDPHKRNSDYWRPVAYYGDIKSLLLSLPDRLVREDERTITTMSELLSEIRRWHDFLNGAATGVEP